MNATTTVGKTVSEKRATFERFKMVVCANGYVNIANLSHNDDSNHTYSVEVSEGEAQSCSCPHHQHRSQECKHMMAVASSPLILSSATACEASYEPQIASDGGEVMEDATGDSNNSLPEITRHVEAPEYGGETYARCSFCEVESVGGPSHILHDDDCPRSTRDRTPKDYSNVQDNGRTEKADFGGGESTGIDEL